MQPVGRMGEKITVLMHRAALDQHVAPERGKSFLEAGCAIDNDEFRRLQTSIDQIIEAFLSSRTRTTVPSRMSLMIGSSFKERAFQSSQSPFTLRQTRLTVSFPTAPPNKAASARRTRRVLVPAR